jgi:hypothetical protein
MKTAEEIYKEMDKSMPFDINNGPKPYIIKAMKIYSNQKLDEAKSAIKENDGVNTIDYVLESLKDQI